MKDQKEFCLKTYKIWGFGNNLTNFDPKQENLNDLLFKFYGNFFRFKVLR